MNRRLLRSASRMNYREHNEEGTGLVTQVEEIQRRMYI